eukprot:TRINITY_DN1432_c1_g1_i1.p1 TRINITY_DN1432_c1_g1~~TRINITY_DN1432_c1_g1_i1.p1  ORF type:complete len:133 (+),score=18.69 TRINITY_DN1432_c1_g1_i1:61-459(+)
MRALKLLSMRYLMGMRSRTTAVNQRRHFQRGTRQIRWNSGSAGGKKQEITFRTGLYIVAMISLICYVFVFLPLRWLSRQVGITSTPSQELSDMEMTALKDDIRILDREVQNISNRVNKTLKMYGIKYIEAEK